jgi:hypothetical protein
LYTFYTRSGSKARAKTQYEYALESTSGQNNNGIRSFGRPENTGCGIADALEAH